MTPAGDRDGGCGNVGGPHEMFTGSTGATSSNPISSSLWHIHPPILSFASGAFAFLLLPVSSLGHSARLRRVVCFEIAKPPGAVAFSFRGCGEAASWP